MKKLKVCKVESRRGKKRKSDWEMKRRGNE